MGILFELIEAFFKAALPIGALSFGMVRWSLHKGYLRGTGGVKALNDEIKTLARADQKNKGEKTKKPARDPVYDKWMKFGGGFYGLVALYTYGVVEWREISGFIADFGGIGVFLRQLDIGLFIRLLIESVINFITAIAWPVYWLSEISTDRIWLWLPTAYCGYWLGMKAAQHLSAGPRGNGAAGE